MRKVSKFLTHKAFYKLATENEPVFVRPTEKPYHAIYRFGEVEKELFSPERHLAVRIIEGSKESLTETMFNPSSLFKCIENTVTAIGEDNRRPLTDALLALGVLSNSEPSGYVCLGVERSKGRLAVTVESVNEKVEYNVDVPAMLKLIFDIIGHSGQDTEALTLLRKISKGKETLSDIESVVNTLNLSMDYNSNPSSPSDDFWSYAGIFKFKVESPENRIIETLLSSGLTKTLPDKNNFMEIPFYTDIADTVKVVRREGLRMDEDFPAEDNKLYLYLCGPLDRFFLVAGANGKAYFIDVRKDVLEARLTNLAEVSASIPFLTPGNI